MPKLELQTEAIPGSPQLTRLNVGGDLSLGNLSELQAALAGLERERRFKVVVDLSGLNFISSSGLGAFLSTVNQFRKGDGDLAFIGLSPKMRKVFTMVGFTKVLTVLPDLDAAVARFGPPPGSGAVRLEARFPEAIPHSGRPFELTVRAVDASGAPDPSYEGTVALKPKWGIVSPPMVGPLAAGRWQGPVILTGAGALTLELSDGDLTGSAQLRVADHLPPATFPLDAVCPGCWHPMGVGSANVYRCRKCSEIYLVDRWGQSITLRKGASGPVPGPQVFHMQFPSDINILGQVRSFVADSVREGGYDEGMADDFELALDEALSNVVEHAYDFDSRQSVSLRLTLDPAYVAVLIRDQGKAFDRTKIAKLNVDEHLERRDAGGLGLFMMDELMDSVEQRSAADGNKLLMVKYVAGAAKAAAQPAPTA